MTSLARIAGILCLLLASAPGSPRAEELEKPLSVEEALEPSREAVAKRLGDAAFCRHIDEPDDRALCVNAALMNRVARDQVSLAEALEASALEYESAAYLDASGLQQYQDFLELSIDADRVRFLACVIRARRSELGRGKTNAAFVDCVRGR